MNTRLRFPFLALEILLHGFWTEKKSAHCEFFATAAALLLRRGGIPSRYVTGFVVPERNEYADCWIVRNRYAHAWVQAWTAEKGWFVVEATPAGGVPESESTSTATELWQFIPGTLSGLSRAAASARFDLDHSGNALAGSDESSNLTSYFARLPAVTPPSGRETAAQTKAHRFARTATIAAPVERKSIREPQSWYSLLAAKRRPCMHSPCALNSMSEAPKSRSGIETTPDSASVRWWPTISKR